VQIDGGQILDQILELELSLDIILERFIWTKLMFLHWNSLAICCKCQVVMCYFKNLVLRCAIISYAHLLTHSFYSFSGELFLSSC